MSVRLRDAWIVLGSNVEPERWVPLALARLAARFSTFAHGGAYRGPARGPSGGTTSAPPFINVAARFSTDLPAGPLALALRQWEWWAGRRRTADRYAPRTLDIDLLLLVEGAHVLHFSARETSHAHVLVPWADLVPHLQLPDDPRSLQQRAAGLAHDLERVALGSEVGA